MNSDELRGHVQTFFRAVGQKELRRTLLKYKLHTGQELFDRAYAYIKQYY